MLLKNIFVFFGRVFDWVAIIISALEVFLKLSSNKLQYQFCYNICQATEIFK